MKFIIAIIFCLGVLSSMDAVPCKDCGLSKEKNRLAVRMARQNDTPTRYIRDDGLCGAKYPIHGKPAECDDKSDNPCCSEKGECGNSRQHCKCWECVDWRIENTIWYCGIDFEGNIPIVLRWMDLNEALDFLGSNELRRRGIVTMKGSYPLHDVFMTAKYRYDGGSIWGPYPQAFAHHVHGKVNSCIALGIPGGRREWALNHRRLPPPLPPRGQ